jgi:HAD superfamily hydrolase (TIGR01509 family)
MVAGRFDLIIFDCDGVLVDSEPIINQAHADVLTQCGYAITAEDLVDRLCGMTDPEMLDVIERQWGRALPSSYAERVASIIEQKFLQSLTAIEGVVEVLDWLPGPACVASSGTLPETRRKLELTGLVRRFGENLFSATMVARGKPAPDLFLYAARWLETAPDRCLVIEDSLAGIDAALAAGMTAIGFCGGSHCPPEHSTRLQERGAALVIAEMRQLPTAIAKLAFSAKHVAVAPGSV